LIPYPGPSTPPGTLTVAITAVYGLKFDRSSLDAPADTPFVIHFENQDTSNGGRNHNVAIKLGDTLLFNPQPPIRTPEVADYFISEGLPAGKYEFVCIVHAVMHGTLTVR
jgi:plastocyanin